MPYGKKKLANGKIQVINKRTGHVFGTHPNEASANAQLAALHINASESDSTAEAMKTKMMKQKG